MAENSGYRERNSTADRALTLLQMFTDARPEVSAIEVAENLGVARSTAYRYLQTLVQSHFLTETGRGGFRLGLRILELARIARRSHGLADSSVPVMRTLADRFHQTVLLTKQMGNSVVCLEREESREQYVRLSYERGTVLSLNAGASALVLLAWLPESAVRRLLSTVTLERYTPSTLTDSDEIFARLAQIREVGYAVSRGEVDATALGIGAPIFDSTGAVSAAISVVLIESRVAKSEITEITDGVVEAAAVLTAQTSLIEG